MIKQTNMIFKLGTLEVHSLAIVQGPPHSIDPIKDDYPTITEEIWWRDHLNVQGHGPFATIYSAVKHYETHYNPSLKRPAYTGNIIEVNFNTKKRL